MITLTTPTIILTQAEFDSLTAMPENILPAERRETLRELLQQLPAIACEIYPCNNICDPQTSRLTVVETVLYHFDRNNRERVAEACGLNDDILMALLIGFVLGSEVL